MNDSLFCTGASYGEKNSLLYIGEHFTLQRWAKAALGFNFTLQRLKLKLKNIWLESLTIQAKKT